MCVEAVRAGANGYLLLHKICDVFHPLRSASAGARTTRVSQRAKDTLLPLVDALLAMPPSVTHAATAAAVLMSSDDPVKA